jgi:hypothetical protein
MTVDITNAASQHNPQLAGSIDNHDKEEHDKEENDKKENDKETEEDPFKVISSVTMELSQLDEDYQNKKLYDGDSDNVHVSDNNNTQNRQDPNDITANASFVETEYGDDPEEENGITVYRDPQTGRYFTSEYDPDEDPGMSMELEIPGEEILVTPDMLQRAEALCAEQEEADTLAVSAVLTYERAWSEITQRAISIGRLSPLAFSTLARQYLAASNRKIDEHLLYWKHQQVLINKADRDLKEAILKVKRDNQLLAEIKGETVEMAEVLAANQQKELMASNLAEVPEPKPDLRRPTVPQSLRSKIDFKRGQHLSRFGGANGASNGRRFPANLQAASVGTHRFATPVSRGAQTPTSLLATHGTSRASSDSVPFAESPTITNRTPTTASNSTTSSPKPSQTAAPGLADTAGCNLRESMGL